MSRIPRVTVMGAVGCLAIVAAACSAPSTSKKSMVGSTTTSLPLTTTTATAERSATTSSTAVASVQNLVVTNETRDGLVTAFVSYKMIAAQEIAGTQPGSVYFAFVSSTNTYWALASFLPTSTASLQTDVSLQDGGGMGIFSEQTGGAWKMVAQGVEPFCPSKTAIPLAVQKVWGLTDPQACS
jgi:hypothetical protein